MAKGNRKRSNAPKKINEEVKINRVNAVPLMQKETVYFQQLVEISNQYAKLKQQSEQYSTIKKGLEIRRKKVQKGEIKLPVQIQIAQGMFYSEDNKKEVLKYLDEQLTSIKNSIKGITNQIENHSDAYVEAGLRLYKFAKGRYGMYKIQEFAPGEIGSNADDKRNLEGDFDTLFKGSAKDIADNPEVMAAFKAAEKVAAEKNSACKCASCKTNKK